MSLTAGDEFLAKLRAEGVYHPVIYSIDKMPDLFSSLHDQHIKEHKKALEQYTMYPMFTLTHPNQTVPYTNITPIYED